MLLDPRHWRPDDLLRRPLRPQDLLGVDGGALHGPAGEGWGFRGAPLTPFALRVAADGELVVPAEGLFRPSHVTQHAAARESGLQVVEDRFVADDDTAVSVLWLRNPTPSAIALDIRVRWGLPAGPGEPGFVHRIAPPGDDLCAPIPAGGRGMAVFALAVARDPDTARRRAETWFADPNAPRRQAQRFQDWFDRAAARFDCDDPYLSRLWAHRWHRVHRDGGGDAPVPPRRDTVRDDFEDGDFDRPRDDARAWERFVLERLAGLRLEPGRLILEPAPDAHGLAHWCVDGLERGGHQITVVWDDPAQPGDAYDDGDKGFTVYVDRRRRFHAQTLEGAALALDEDDPFDDFPPDPTAR